MDLDQFIARVNPVRLKRAGDAGYLASCPCPDHGQGYGDRHQSLSISAGQAGGVVLYCHAGCETADVVAAFGLKMADLRNGTNGLETPTMAEPRTAQRHPRIAATYRYVDEDGQLLFQVIRYAPKDFRQRRPDGDGDWTWKLGDTRRVLYRLPELIAAVSAGTPIFICEGEKDAEALRGAGCVATCNPHGAGKWRPEYNECLRGAQVTVVQDKDEPGRKHGAAVAAALRPVAASLRIVEAAVGKDAADHIAAGRTLAEFVDAAAAASSPAPEGGTPRLKLVRMADVVPLAVEWLWETRLPRGKLAVLAGDPGLGKSYLTLWIAAVVSSGGEWPDGTSASAASVLILSAEDDAADTIRPRLDRLGADVSRIFVVDGVLRRAEEPEQPFSLRLDLQLLGEAVVDGAAALVIVDPLNAYLGGIDSHKAAEVRGVLSPLAHMAATTHAAVLAVHHLNKGSSANALYRASGSLDFVAAARIVHGVAPDPEAEGRRLFVPLKCNIGVMPDGLGFRIDADGVAFDDEPVTLDAAAAFGGRQVDREELSEREQAKEFLRAELADGPVPAHTLYSTAEGFGHSSATLRRAAGELHVEKRKQGFQGRWQWSLPSGPAQKAKGDRPRQVSAFDTFGPSRLDTRPTVSTFAGTPAGVGERGRDPGRASATAYAKDAHLQEALSLDDAKGAQPRRRDAFAERDGSRAGAEVGDQALGRGDEEQESVAIPTDLLHRAAEDASWSTDL